MRDIVILGVGGHGRETLEVLEAMRDDAAALRVIGFLDDAAGHAERSVHGLPVLGDRQWMLRPEARHVAVALGLGAPAVRRAAAEWAKQHGIAVPPLRHPTSLVSRRVAIPDGVMLMSHARVSIDVQLGPFVHLNHASSVSHDCALGAFATLAPGAYLAGAVVLDEGAELGIGAVAIPGVHIGAWSVVGAGAVVTTAVPPNAIAAGVPATVRRVRETGWHTRA